jgi:hypothetical protein
MVVWKIHKSIHKPQQDCSNTFHQEDEFKVTSGTYPLQVMTWKKKLDNAISKAYRTFWVCRSMFAKM